MSPKRPPKGGVYHWVESGLEQLLPDPAYGILDHLRSPRPAVAVKNRWWHRILIGLSGRVVLAVRSLAWSYGLFA